MNLKNNTLNQRSLLHKLILDESMCTKFRKRSGCWLPLGASEGQGCGGCCNLLQAAALMEELQVPSGCHYGSSEATRPQPRTAHDQWRDTSAGPFWPSCGPPTCSRGFWTSHWPGPSSPGLHCPLRLLLSQLLPPPPAFPRVWWPSLPYFPSQTFTRQISCTFNPILASLLRKPNRHRSSD